MSKLLQSIVGWYQRYEMPVLTIATIGMSLIALILLIGAVNDSAILYKEF